MSATNASARNWLLASLALNVFLLGAVIGGAAFWWHDRPGPQSPAGGGLRQAADSLPDGERQRLMAVLRETQRGNRELASAAQAGRAEVLQLLQQEPLDTAAIEQALWSTRDLDANARARLESAVVAFAATLEPDQRRLLAEGLSRHGAFRLRRDGKAGRGATQDEAP